MTVYSLLLGVVVVLGAAYLALRLPRITMPNTQVGVVLVIASILVLCGALMAVNEALLHNIHVGLVALCYAGMALSSLLMVSIVSAERPELQRVLVRIRS